MKDFNILFKYFMALEPNQLPENVYKNIFEIAFIRFSVNQPFFISDVLNDVFMEGIVYEKQILINAVSDVCDFISTNLNMEEITFEYFYEDVIEIIKNHLMDVVDIEKLDICSIRFIRVCIKQLNTSEIVSIQRISQNTYHYIPFVSYKIILNIVTEIFKFYIFKGLIDKDSVKMTLFKNI